MQNDLEQLVIDDLAFEIVKERTRKRADVILAENPEINQVVVCSGSFGEPLPKPEGLTIIIQNPLVAEPFVVVRGRAD